MEYVINAVHDRADRADIAHIADIKLYLISDLGHSHLKIVTHVVLLFLVAGKNSYLSDICFEKAIQNNIAERTRSSGYQQCFIFKQ